MLLSKNEAEQLSIACSLLARFLMQAPNEETWQEFSALKQMTWVNTKAKQAEQRAFEALQTSLNEDLETVIVDYNRLFIGPDILKASPWASIYLSEKKYVFGQETLKVKHFYEKYQMDLPSALNEPADHIGFEFRFISILLTHFQKANKEARAYIEQDINFFVEKHFLSWVPLCLENIKQNAETSFYKNIAILALFIIEYLQKIIDIDNENQPL